MGNSVVLCALPLASHPDKSCQWEVKKEGCPFPRWGKSWKSAGQFPPQGVGWGRWFQRGQKFDQGAPWPQHLLWDLPRKLWGSRSSFHYELGKSHQTGSGREHHPGLCWSGWSSTQGTQPSAPCPRERKHSAAQRTHFLLSLISLFS